MDGWIPARWQRVSLQPDEVGCPEKQPPADEDSCRLPGFTPSRYIDDMLSRFCRSSQHLVFTHSSSDSYRRHRDYRVSRPDDLTSKVTEPVPLRVYQPGMSSKYPVSCPGLENSQSDKASRSFHWF